MEKKLLVTGFDPFDGCSANPSWAVARSLPERIGNYRVYKLQLNTLFSVAAQTALQRAGELGADAIVCLGVAGGRDAVTVERIGINIRSARVPDNAGCQPSEQSIIPDGADGLFATVPVSRMAEAMKAAGCPAAISNTAGTYVCNDVLYTLLAHYRGSGVQVGFVHVPWLPGQGTPSLPLETMVKGLTAAIETLV